MGKGTRQSLKEGMSSGDTDVIDEREARPTFFAPLNERDVRQPSNRSLSLRLTDFQELVRRSTASIGCVAFSRPVPLTSTTPRDFSERLYATASSCLEINDAFARLRGHVKGRQLIGASLATLLPPHSGFSDLFAEWYRRSLSMEGFEWNVVNPDGQEILLHAALYATVIDNAITRIWIIFRDVSALSRAITAVSTTERHYRDILDQPGLLFFRVYLDGTLAFATAETRQAFALREQNHSPIEDELRARAHPEDRHVVDQIEFHRHSLSLESLTASIRLVTERHGLCSYEVRMIPRLLSDTVDGFDILALRHAILGPSTAEDDITVMLAAGLAHDANNSLAVASGSIELARGLLPAGHPALELLTSASQSLSNCAAVNAQAIELSSGLQPKPERVDIPRLFEETVRQLNSVMPQGIQLLSALGTERLATWVDPIHISQIILNLALNARDALGATGIITLTATRQGSGPTESAATRSSPIFISVSDNGPGIEDSIRDKLFEPFVSSKSKTRTRGLGLTMVKTLTELNGGAITVTSARGIGTTFTLSLPDASGIAENTTTRPHYDALNQGRADSPLKVLVADDESEVRKTLLSAFTSRGHQVSAVPDAKSMFSEIRRHSYDILVVDNGMLEVSTDEASENIRALAPELPILVTSGNTALRAQFRAEVDRRFLAKPFALAELFQVVESLAPASE